MPEVFYDYRSPNHDARPGDKSISLILLHYTGMQSAAAAIDRLCDETAKVSAHHVIDEDGKVYALVDESRRAWHAGIGHWAGQDDINGISIGIELVNPGHEFGYRDFTAAQFEALGPLTRDILVRHKIPRHRVLGHADVAPARKQDPGENFFWDRLAWQGMGLWPPLDFLPERDGPKYLLGNSAEEVAEVRSQLAQLGYGIPISGQFDEEMRFVVIAFQRHWRQRLVDGVFDGECHSILMQLLDRMPA